LQGRREEKDFGNASEHAEALRTMQRTMKHPMKRTTRLKR